jgi:cytochrome c-type biogenesis protein CcmH
MKRLLMVLLFALTALTALAAHGEETPLADPAQEARAKALMRELRCVACENEPVSQSAAPIAEDMRQKVRDLVASGASDAEVLGWFEDRYGSFVRFRPPARSLAGMALWSAPFVLLLVGLALIWRLRRKPGEPAASVPPDAL